VLVEGDDMNEPIADAVRSILDGHIVLSRTLAHRGHYPAVDVLSSVSRLTNALLDEGQREAGSRVREMMAAYARAEDLIAIGAYVHGSDPRVDEARAKRDDIDAFLRQTVEEPYDRTEAFARLDSLAGGGWATPGSSPVQLPATVSGELVLSGAFNPLPPGAQVVA
jgi:flagellum-specific ATP synthase